MDLEKGLLIVALTLIVSLIIVQFLKVQVRVMTESISKERLIQLMNDNNFRTLYLNPFSETSFFKRDMVHLDSHIEKVNDKKLFVKTKLLEPTQEKGEVLNREIGYSIYRIGKHDIERILEHFPGAEVLHFLFEAVLYKKKGDKDFIAYKIFPATQSKRRLFHDWKVVRNSLTKFPIEENEIRRDSVEAEDLSFDSERDYILMKPSPPASSSFE